MSSDFKMSSGEPRAPEMPSARWAIRLVRLRRLSELEIVVEIAKGASRGDFSVVSRIEEDLAERAFLESVFDVVRVELERYQRTWWAWAQAAGVRGTPREAPGWLRLILGRAQSGGVSTGTDLVESGAAKGLPYDPAAAANAWTARTRETANIEKARRYQ